LQQRQPWYYQSDSNYINTLGGYARKYPKNIDVLTVKGSGHFVPLDRPAQSLQMIYNWIRRADYSTPYMQTTSTTTSPTSTSPVTTTPIPTTGTTTPSSNTTVPSPTIPVPSNSSTTPSQSTTTLPPTSPGTSPNNNLGTSPTSPVPESTSKTGGSSVYYVYSVVCLIVLRVLFD
ncbi:hypothetical protein TELCIR_20231, partial [Teladorsagia circumcincta]